MKTIASAPSNIALIKYMGKTSTEANIPTNSSLSFTLENLRSFVQITKIEEAKDRWAPLKQEGLATLTLNDKGQEKFLKHFSMIYKHL